MKLNHLAVECESCDVIDVLGATVSLLDKYYGKITAGINKKVYQ